MNIRFDFPSFVAAAAFTIALYAVTQPFRRFIDKKLDEYEDLERTESEF